jgi:hypothetical protein
MRNVLPRSLDYFFSWDSGTWDKTEADGTNRIILQVWWDSGTIGVKYNRHNNKLSHQSVPFSGPMGQKEFRVQASACLFAGREDKLKLALLAFLGQWAVGQNGGG